MKNNQFSPIRRFVQLLLTVILFTTSTQSIFAQSNTCEIHYTRLNNSVVESQIVQYFHYIDSVMPKEEYLTTVDLCRVGVMDYISIGYKVFDDDIIFDLDYHMICKIEGRDVLFSFQKPITPDGIPFFCHDNQEREQIIKNNFPKAYKAYLESLKSKDKFAIEVGLNNCITFKLEFKRGKLIKRLICTGEKPCITQEY